MRISDWSSNGCSSDLQRNEEMIIVAIDNRHPNGLAAQFPRAGETGEPATQYNDMGGPTCAHSPPGVAIHVQSHSLLRVEGAWSASPARLDHAWQLSSRGKVPQHHPSQFELAIIGARASRQFAPEIGRAHV